MGPRCLLFFCYLKDRSHFPPLFLFSPRSFIKSRPLSLIFPRFDPPVCALLPFNSGGPIVFPVFLVDRDWDSFKKIYHDRSTVSSLLELFGILYKGASGVFSRPTHPNYLVIIKNLSLKIFTSPPPTSITEYIVCNPPIPSFPPASTIHPPQPPFFVFCVTAFFGPTFPLNVYFLVLDPIFFLKYEGRFKHETP